MSEMLTPDRRRGAYDRPFSFRRAIDYAFIVGLVAAVAVEAAGVAYYVASSDTPAARDFLGP